MKKLLIIQMDEAYFLFETLVMLDRYRDSFKTFELTLLVNPNSLSQVKDGSEPIIAGVTTNIEKVLESEFDVSANLSMTESSWPIHNQVNAGQKLGPYIKDGQLLVQDAWSSFLLTLKSRAPFLTFHIQDIYKNILGVKRVSFPIKEVKNYQQIIISFCNTNFFTALEQEKLINIIHSHYPNLKIRDISEIDPVSNLSQILYIGPATLDALKLCEDGATGIFLFSQFQGFNLLPFNEGHYVVSSRNSQLLADKLFPLIAGQIQHHEIPASFPYSVYQTDEENLFGSYLKSLNTSDDSYPIYQSHVVLWNFILNLFDVHLEIMECNTAQIGLLKTQADVLAKLIRLYDFAMSSVDTIHSEAKSNSADLDKIQGHKKNLQDIEVISDKISQSHSFLRPILDFYRIRRGQNSGNTLLQQAQNSFLNYSEEHQAMKAMLELFTVTLRKNEVSI